MRHEADNKVIQLSTHLTRRIHDLQSTVSSGPAAVLVAGNPAGAAGAAAVMMVVVVEVMMMTFVTGATPPIPTSAPR